MNQQKQNLERVFMALVASLVCAVIPTTLVIMFPYLPLGITTDGFWEGQTVKYLTIPLLILIMLASLCFITLAVQVIRYQVFISGYGLIGVRGYNDKPTLYKLLKFVEVKNGSKFATYLNASEYFLVGISLIVICGVLINLSI